MVPLARLSGVFAALSGPVRAALWVTAAGTFFTLTMAVVRHLAPGIHIFEIVFFRSLFGLVFMLPWLVRRGPAALHTSRAGLFALRGALAFLTGVFLFYATVRIPLADLISIGFTRPIFGSIAAIVFLGEVVRARRWSAIAAGFAGTLIIVRPGFQEINPGVLFALAAVAVQTWNTLNVKMLSRTEHPDTIAVYHAVVILPLAAAPTLWVWTTPDAGQLGWLVVVGAFGLLTQRAVARAFAAVDATLVMALGFTRLPVAALIGFVVFGEVPEFWVWVGGTVICAASAYIAHREAAAARRGG